MSGNFEDVGKQFCQHYFTTFDTNRSELAGLYTAESMLTYESEQFLGVEAILEKLQGLPNIKHEVTTCDLQPTLNNGIIAFVTGTLSIDGGPGMKFTHVFHLAQG